MTDTWSDSWDWLRDSPLFLLTATLAAYQVGLWLRDRTSRHPLAQPVLVAIVIVGGLITLLDIDYPGYRDATELITFWLGPATVALAIPLHRQLSRLRGLIAPMVVGVLVGAATSVTTGVLLLRLLDGDDVLERSLAAKATTTPVAIALTESIGGVGELAAVFAILVGILGAVAGPSLLDLLRVRDPRVRGLAVGSVSHGIGTARMLHDNEIEGAFSGLAMGLTALATSAVLPLLALALFSF